MSQNQEDIEYRDLFDQFVQLPEGNGCRSPSPPPIQPFHPRSLTMHPGPPESPMKGAPQVALLLGGAPSMAPVIGGSNIKDQHDVLPETAAARANNHSYASTEQRENASLPTWGTSGADILSNDSISPTFIPTPISPLALSDGGAPQKYSPTDIPGEAIGSTGSTSTHEREVMGGNPQPIVQPRGLPAEEFEDDVSKLEARLLQKGAEPSAVGVCAKIFSKGISIAALEVPMTREESIEHGVVGERYRMLLEKRTESGGTKNRCRLCSQRGLVEYKNHRDALRHLLKDHFGMGYECEYNCTKVCYTPAELVKHVRISHSQ